MAAWEFYTGSAKHEDSEVIPFRWTRNERFILFVVGASFGGFLFCGALHTFLSPPNRPVVPEAARGFLHLFHTKYGYVYGSRFEYLAVTYGVFTTWIAGVFCGLFLKIKLRSRAHPRYPIEIVIAALISIAVYYVIWRLSIYVARS